jgi:hypothetical protein
MTKHSVLIFFILCTTLAIAQNDWGLKKDAQGIKIYTRSVNDSPIKEYKATTILNSSIDKVLSELLNAPQYTDDCESGQSFYVTRRGNNQHVFYARKELPWPVRNRDIVTLLTVQKISATKVKLHLESLPEGIPEKQKTIRIKELMGFWLLEEENGKTKVTQQLYLNPEGSLPSAITNALLIKGPFKTFTELQKATK